MHNRVDILRVPPAPYNTPMYVYRAGTENQVVIYKDRSHTNVMSQPILMGVQNIHFYCKQNIRVDIKMIHEMYEGGFLLIEDQLLINQDTYLDRVLTMLDGSITADINGNLMVEEL